MNNSVFGKSMESVRKHQDINLVTTKVRRNYLVFEPKAFSPENLLAIEIKRKVISLTKDKSDRKIMKEFVGLRAKEKNKRTYSYLTAI